MPQQRKKKERSERLMIHVLVSVPRLLNCQWLQSALIHVPVLGANLIQVKK